MALSHEHEGFKILAKIKIYNLTRAELLFNLCYEIPCIIHEKTSSCLVISTLGLAKRNLWGLGTESWFAVAK